MNSRDLQVGDRVRFGTDDWLGDEAGKTGVVTQKGVYTQLLSEPDAVLIRLDDSGRVKYVRGDAPMEVVEDGNLHG